MLKHTINIKYSTNSQYKNMYNTSRNHIVHYPSDGQAQRFWQVYYSRYSIVIFLHRFLKSPLPSLMVLQCSPYVTIITTNFSSLIQVLIMSYKSFHVLMMTRCYHFIFGIYSNISMTTSDDSFRLQEKWIKNFGIIVFIHNCNLAV